MSNLPSWPGADSCYERAEKKLSEMAKNGHVTIKKRYGKTYCVVSDDMEYIIKALNEGNEEIIKSFLMFYDKMA